jgi:hypothetical protein
MIKVMPLQPYPMSSKKLLTEETEDFKHFEKSAAVTLLSHSPCLTRDKLILMEV